MDVEDFILDDNDVVVNYDEYLGEGNTIANSVTSISDIEDKINNLE